MKFLGKLIVAASLALASSPAIAAQGSGCLPTTGIVSGLTLTQDTNAAIAALISSNSGASAPLTDCTTAPVKGQLWLDTSVTPNQLKQYDGSAWVVIGAQDATNHLWSPPIGGGNANVTAASTTDICAAPAAVQTIAGTTTITSFGSACVVGVRKTLIFSSATPITYNATSLILPGQSSLTTAAGDVADAIYLGSGNWRIINVTKIDGSSVTNPAVALGTVQYGDYGTIPPKTVRGQGQALSRAGYPAYLAAVTRTQTGALTAGSTSILSIANLTGLGVGMPVEGTGIPAGTTITLVTGSGIVMSAAATANGTQTFTAFLTGYGAGGDSTTVGVKNCVGRMLAGIDPSATNLSAASAINSTQGSATRALATTNLPPHTHSGTTAIESAVHTHNLTGVTVSGPYGLQGGSSVTGGLASAITGTTAGENQNHTHGFTTDNGSGSSAPFSIVPPIATAECVVAVLP